MKKMKKMKKKADISAIITCYNEGHFIGGALDSILAQTAVDRIAEIIIVDDGSDDATRAAVENAARRDSRVRAIFQENQGVSVARNRAICECRGEYVAILDADDIWLPDKLERQMPLMDSDQRVGLSYTDLCLVEPEDLGRRRVVRCRSFQPDSTDALIRYFVDDAPIITSCMVLRRAVFDKVGFFDPSFRISEDTEMCIRVMERFPVAHLPEITLLKRFRADSLGADVRRNMPFYERVTETAATRTPQLRPYRAARTARRLTKVGQYCERSGDIAEARKAYRDVLRNDPRFLKGYALYGLSFLPRGLTGFATATLKKVLHRSAKAPVR